MILANVAVAQELREQRVPALLRVHAPPDESKLEQLRATLRILGIELQLPEPVQARDLGAIAARVRDPESRALHRDRWSCAPWRRRSTSPTTSATSAWR